ncbi:MAG: hypothetical protein ACD_23C00703G0002 [uncultured bacterium]|nr:MAG: hypothetical protein ACD_23C00703G0002 [uncultured bacterium]
MPPPCQPSTPMALVEGHQPYALPALGHPILLVGVVAAEIVHFSHSVHVHDVFHQCHRENGTW